MQILHSPFSQDESKIYLPTYFDHSSGSMLGKISIKFHKILINRTSTCNRINGSRMQRICYWKIKWQFYILMLGFDLLLAGYSLITSDNYQCHWRHFHYHLAGRISISASLIEFDYQEHLRAGIQMSHLMTSVKSKIQTKGGNQPVHNWLWKRLLRTFFRCQVPSPEYPKVSRLSHVNLHTCRHILSKYYRTQIF